MSSDREQSEPANANWYVEVIHGKTHCKEHGSLCELGSCQRKYGTSTDYNHGYYNGIRPGERAVKSLIPEDHYEIERKIKRCPDAGDTAECRYCGTDITFTHGYPHWVSEDESGDCAQAEEGEHEPTDEYHE